MRTTTVTTTDTEIVWWYLSGSSAEQYSHAYLKDTFDRVSGCLTEMGFRVDSLGEVFSRGWRLSGTFNLQEGANLVALITAIEAMCQSNAPGFDCSSKFTIDGRFTT